MSNNEEEALYPFDDYFDDPEDRGLEVVIRHRGKDIPFRVKRALPLGAQTKARNAAIKIKLDEKGRATVTEADDAAFSEGIVLAGLLWWPFEYSPGKPVPINKKTIAALDGVLTDALAKKILGIGEAQQAALDPFALKSDEA